MGLVISIVSHCDECICYHMEVCLNAGATIDEIMETLKMAFFGGDGVISENDPEEQEKRIKYNDLVANAVIFQNVVDITLILWSLMKEG